MFNIEQSMVVGTNKEGQSKFLAILDKGIAYPMHKVDSLYAKEVGMDTSYNVDFSEVMPKLNVCTNIHGKYEAVVGNKRFMLGTICSDTPMSTTCDILDSPEFCEWLEDSVKLKTGKSPVAVMKSKINFVQKINERLKSEKLRESSEVNPEVNAPIELIPSSTGETLEQALTNLDENEKLPTECPVHVEVVEDLLTEEEEIALQKVSPEEMYKREKNIKFIEKHCKAYVDECNEEARENANSMFVSKNTFLARIKNDENLLKVTSDFLDTGLAVILNLF